MHSDLALKVSNLSKRFTIGSQKNGSLRASLSRFFNLNSVGKTTDFWALENVSFEINKGDVVGIIGKNGAGKSTLLKILSQISPPTTGRIELFGRVASLLEVGTGFHPELTGRENIYLNGTILGMTRKEVNSKFDEIVAFSGVEKFIDTPVKHYSSGMYVRLAFAVAAHLEPEILIIDEVLAVGDASFQKKCLGKMKEVAENGRTILFVRHDLGAVNSLCNKGILMENGKIICQDSIEKVSQKYLAQQASDSTNKKQYIQKEYSEYDGKVDLISVQLVDEDLNPISSLYVNETAGIKIKFKVNTNENIFPIPNLHVSHGLGGKIFVSVNNCAKETFSEAGTYETVLCLPKDLFNNGFFNLGIAISTLDPVQVHVADYDALSFEVLDVLNANTRNGYTGKMDGYLRPSLDWTNKKVNE
jgi:lipopolysaccharide transport system ATP-binding protein